ncbi:hypothetical protein ASPZODRAFT_314313 [Penicilliopsis zonata CBS 506.65]|uniref:EKC/KEOPS complex subunit BUD32 n=1 Tax=Penicilliopsis zonata CBS 506.65 TaxID=1073090 RepID=A0A1L9SV21_9EURO|nr:hypothetical protein ASPZODRAFT_314313 [Penicilliopsis zonata CBS 506.65]OJJ51072.1 hypothetical protein ASPZODRAFT_314313 [Penicilliopsis zonata CBS 506.65]
MGISGEEVSIVPFIYTVTRFAFFFFMLIVKFADEIDCLAYGTILVARESEPEDPENPRHYAIKIHHHKSLEWANIQGHSPTMGLWKDDMYIPMEAMGLALVWNSDVFPSFDSVYTHNDWHMTIMSAALDYDPIRNTIPDDDDDEDCAAINRFRAFIGTRCFDKKDTLLNEQQACKVSSQMLRGLRELLDMNIVHGDISLNNFVVGEDFSTKLLDLGLMSFDVQQDKLVFTDWAWVPFHEYHMLPEMAIEFSKPEIIAAYKTERQHRVHVKSHGSMMDLWRSSCIAFMLAHGHAPWENPEWNAHLARVWRTHESTGLQDGENYRDFWNARIEERNARRDRIINEECPMAEHLSQDCIDAFRVMLARDPSQRPNVAELETFPWFQSSWMDQDLGRRAHFVSHIKVDFDEGHGPSA